MQPGSDGARHLGRVARLLAGSRSGRRHRELGEDGDDKIDVANKVKGERINCGAGKKDKATVDKGDKPKKNCEKVERK